MGLKQATGYAGGHDFFMKQFHQARKVVLCLCAAVLILTGWASPVLAQQAYPDLVAISVTGPSSAGPGQQITVTFTIKNQGPVDAHDFNAGVYLSSDDVITTDDNQLRTVPICGLLTGATLIVPVTVTVPSVTNGTYYLGLIADIDDNVQESDETNNIAKSQISISAAPHLSITSISFPAIAYPGGGAQFSVTVLNDGFESCYAKIFRYTFQALRDLRRRRA